jgi:hypothetical protein
MIGGLGVARGRGALAGALTAGMAAGPGVAHASDIMISDGTFNNWKFGSYVAGSGSPTATMSVEKRAGNPAPELVNTTVTGTGGIAGGYGYDVGSPVNAYLNRSKFVLTVQMKSGAGAPGVGEDIALVVFQQGIAFVSYFPKKIGKSHGKWKTITFDGRLVNGYFTSLEFPGLVPDFKDPDVTTYFGLYVQNSGAGEKVRNFYDNYTLTITPKQ